MTEYECRVCGKFIKSDTSHKKLYEHLTSEHTKKQLIPFVGWWIIN